MNLGRTSRLKLTSRTIRRKRWYVRKIHAGLFSFFFWLLAIFLPKIAWPEDVPSWKIQAAVSTGTLTIPNGIDWFGVLGIDLQIIPPSCTILETKMDCELLSTTVRFGFNGEQDFSYLPHIEWDLKVIELRPKSWFSILGPELLFERYALPESLDMHATLRVSVAGIKFSFWKKRTYIQGGCQADFSLLGGRYVAYESGVIPFSGMYLAGVSPQCVIRLGNSSVYFEARLFSSIDVSVGQSGAGNPEISGNFGSLFSEAQLGSLARLNVRLLKTRLWNLEAFLQADGRFLVFLDTGERSNNGGGFLGIYAGLRLTGGQSR